jgi:hypothetical protein
LRSRRRLELRSTKPALNADLSFLRSLSWRSATVIFIWPKFWPVAISNSLMAIAGNVFGPAVAALTLGLYARTQLARRIRRNSAFDHAGNIAVALLAGVVGYAFS